jgi:hypothetical protein
MDESEKQSEKHDDPIISTEHGIKIGRSFEDENADDSIRFNDDSNSNEMDESDVHRSKQDEPRI